MATFSATSLTFSGSLVGQASPSQTVSLRNSGSAALTVTAVTLSGADASFFTLTNGCTAAVPAGSSCGIGVVFTGTDSAPRTATVTVTSNASTPSQTIALSGTSAVAPAAVLSTTSLVFKDALVNRTTAAQTVTLTNSGSAPLSINSILLSANTGSAGSSAPTSFASTNNCASTLPVGGFCTITVTFMPTDATSRSAVITLVSNAIPSTQTIALSGTVALLPAAVLSSTALMFPGGTLNTTGPAQMVTLSNPGTAPLTIGSIVLSGTDATFFTSTNTCSATLAAGASCNISASFTPTDLANRNAVITISTDATPASQTITLTGGVTITTKCTTTVPRKSPPSATPTFAGAAVTGKVLAGALPLIGSSVQLYAAGNTGNGLAPTALGAAVTTDSNGGFAISTGYTCPFDLSTLYLVARGGKAGATGTVNSSTVLMTALGSCNALPATPVVVNEVTTVASVYALSQFLSAGAGIGASATNFNGLKLAAAAAANLVALSTGRAPGASFPSTGTPPTLVLHQLANAVNACVAAATATPCSQLFAAATVSGAAAPSTTLDALLNVARHPAANVAALYTLSTTSSAFSPVAAAAPSDFTLFITYTGGGMHAPSGLGIDSVGNIAVANYFNVASLFTNTGVPIAPAGVTGGNLHESYGLAVDQADRIWIPNEETPYAINAAVGAVTVLSAAVPAPALTLYASGGLNFPSAVAFDAMQTAWIADYGNAHVTLLSPTGAPLSGPSGYGPALFAFPVGVATDSKCFDYFANQAAANITRVAPDGSSFTAYATGTGPSGLAVDSADNVWSANYYGNTVGLLAADGNVLSANYTGGGLKQPQGIAVDGANNVWVANYRGPSITELASAMSANPGLALSPAAGYGPDAKLLEAYALAIDSAGNVWVTNFGNDSLTEFIGLAAPVRTPFVGPMTQP